jgi:hypothetical protein
MGPRPRTWEKAGMRGKVLGPWLSGLQVNRAADFQCFVDSQRLGPLRNLSSYILRTPDVIGVNPRHGRRCGRIKAAEHYGFWLQLHTIAATVGILMDDATPQASARTPGDHAVVHDMTC